jgi:hypothetical protein
MAKALGTRASSLPLWTSKMLIPNLAKAAIGAQKLIFLFNRKHGRVFALNTRRILELGNSVRQRYKLSLHPLPWNSAQE